MDKDNKTSSKL